MVKEEPTDVDQSLDSIDFQVNILIYLFRGGGGSNRIKGD